VLLTLTFKAREAQIAADVVNEYVTQILAASVRLRTGQAGETLSFFEQEVQRLGDELERRSTRITEYQRENADALPVIRSSACSASPCCRNVSPLPNASGARCATPASARSRSSRPA
jgi:hypothetical protein